MTGFSIVFYLMFGLFLVAFVTNFVKGIAQWKKNNNSPKLTVTAKVAAKRTSVSHTQHTNGGDITGAHGYYTTSSTSYYATFQFESGDRLELSLNGYEYSMLADGDYGKLSFQGTRFLGFERIK